MITFQPGLGRCAQRGIRHRPLGTLDELLISNAGRHAGADCTKTMHWGWDAGIPQCVADCYATARRLSGCSGGTGTEFRVCALIAAC